MVRITDPEIDERRPQPYVGCSARVSVGQLPDVIPATLDTVFGWLGRNGAAPAGPPFVRYLVIDMDAELRIEIGVPVAGPVTGDDEVFAALLPGGRFASLVYTGVDHGLAGNRALIDWAAERGLRWDHGDDPNGGAFACRVEWLLDGPDDDPDPANWRTEVAIKLAED